MKKESEFHSFTVHSFTKKLQETDSNRSKYERLTCKCKLVKMPIKSGNLTAPPSFYRKIFDISINFPRNTVFRGGEIPRSH